MGNSNQLMTAMNGDFPELALSSIKSEAMSRRQLNPSRRIGDGGAVPLATALQSKSRSSPVLSIALIITVDLAVVKLWLAGLKKEDTEAWGVEPYDIEDADANCKSLVRKGIVRVADIKFSLPYRAKSFSLVIISDALDYVSPKYLNKTLPELARVSADGYPGQQRAKVADKSKFGRPAKMRSLSWWIRFFVQTSLEENEVFIKKFEQAAEKGSYKPMCQIFHLKSYH
ncbi:hypothetical protein HYC85_023936 [Camellia sinensis]|uniref:Uncharacterized protein n=1 Tax=Camellia sinensis TaxID=4442 RepID=A0A7J7GGQ8_CAMSI|nr:hypothetical protein HYC85_023936 [Camellia sinensis]